jgi:hypothetical protein
MTEASEEQIAALREAIREAGHPSRRLRLGCLVCLMFFAILGGLPVAIQLGLPQHSATAAVTEFARVVGGFLLLATVVSIGTAMAIGALERDHNRVTLARRLAELSPAQQAELLLPLVRDPVADTRMIVKPIASRLKSQGELTPSDPPHRPRQPAHPLTARLAHGGGNPTPAAAGGDQRAGP